MLRDDFDIGVFHAADDGNGLHLVIKNREQHGGNPPVIRCRRRRFQHHQCMVCQTGSHRIKGLEAVFVRKRLDTGSMVVGLDELYKIRAERFHALVANLLDFCKCHG